MGAKRGWRDTHVGRILSARAGDDPGGYPPRGVELALVRPWVRIDGRDVLELGCGYGRLTFQYASHARSVVALDPNGAQIEIATQRARARGLEHVRFVVGTAQRPPDEKFDIALFTWSLWWVAQRGMVDALEAVRTRLRRRGVIVDLQPDLTYQPAVYVSRGSRRLLIGAVTRTLDENILAAHIARDRAVALGRFRLVASGGATFRARHALASFGRELADNENWSLPRGFPARLAAAARPGTQIQIEKRFDFVVLRRTWDPVRVVTSSFA